MLRITWALTTVLLASEFGLLGGSASLTGADPTVTNSRYVTSHSNSDFYNWGCARGSTGEIGTVVLAFGRPAFVSGIGYGTYIPGGDGGFASISEIEANAKAFASGYYNCAPASGTFVTMVLGTSNFGPQVNNGHGSAWADMVNRVQAFITSPPSWGAKIQADGGSDVEVGWNSATTSKGWVLSYDSTNQRSMYDFGDAGGCPSSGTVSAPPGWACQSGGQTWHHDDLWYVTWGSPPAYGIPEIYADPPPGQYSVQAWQWQKISLYAATYKSGKIQLSGSMAQHGACADIGDPCAGTDNTPQVAWANLWGTLQSSAATAWSPPWSTDIRWTY